MRTPPVRDGTGASSRHAPPYDARIRLESKCLQSVTQARLTRGDAAPRPHLFDIVECSNFGPEDMNNHVTGVDQHPIAMRQALDSDAGEPGPLKVLHDLIGHGAYMATGPSGGHDHVVGDYRLGAQIDCGGILGLHIVEAREDDAKRLIGVGPHF